MPPANPQPQIVESVETVILDQNGDELLRIAAREITILQPGSNDVTKTKIHENIVLVDGTNWNAAMLFSQPPVHIAACRICRDPPWTFPCRERPSHGLMRLTKPVCPCGQLCCPRHLRRCSDGRSRCLRCTRKFFWKSLLLNLFYWKG